LQQLGIEERALLELWTVATLGEIPELQNPGWTQKVSHSGMRLATNQAPFDGLGP
jgi:hypothetical protein